MPDVAVRPSRRLAVIERWPETDDELDAFVQAIWGIRLARTTVCEGHTAPFTAFADAYFARAGTAIWEASRGLGGKSMMLATLGVTELTALQANVTILGGSGEQSANVHSYMSAAWKRPFAPRQLLKTDPTARVTEMQAGNTCRALMASQTSVRGPHPERLRLDEVDEMDLSIFNAALGQPISRNNIKSHSVLASTHQNFDGTFTYAKSLAKKKNWPVYRWCYRENLLENGGWLTAEELQRTRDRIPEAMWQQEYELMEESPGRRAINTGKVDMGFDPSLGEFEGEADESLTFEDPVPGAPYITGIDWAKDEHWTIIDTGVVLPDGTIRRVAWERRGRVPWPVIFQYARERLEKYPGRTIHDLTGLGKVINDTFEPPEESTVEGVWMEGKMRVELFSDYIVAIESNKILSPRITYAHREHRFCTVKDLYGTGHPPDSVVGGALMYRARLLAEAEGGVRRVAKGKRRIKTREVGYFDPRGE